MRLLSVLALVAPAAALWPIPIDISTGNKTLFIDKTINITYNGEPVRLRKNFLPFPLHN